MSDYNNRNYLKLSLELLSSVDINKDLGLLLDFVTRAENQTFIDNFAEGLDMRWGRYQQLVVDENTDEGVNSSLDIFKLETEEKVDVKSNILAENKENLLEKNKESVEKISEKIDVKSSPSSEKGEKFLDDGVDVENESLVTKTQIDNLPITDAVAETPKKEIEMKPAKPSVLFKLSNATVGRKYKDCLETMGAITVSIDKIMGLEKLGLVYDAESNTLEGEPLIAGDHLLTIFYQYKHYSYTNTMNLVINNDPKSLWKNISSDETVKYWKADDDNKGILGLYEWKLVAASKRGRSHAHVGSCRDDDFALTIENETHWHIATVADGAGSSDYSREGARVIVENSQHTLSLQLKEYDAQLMTCLESWQQNKDAESEEALNAILYEIFAPVVISSVDKITELAKNDERSFRDYYSTLLIAAHKPLANGSFSIAYWIGDGGLGIYKKGESINLLGKVDSGDYAGQTRFLDSDSKKSEDIKTRIHFSFDTDFTALILMTDGISDPLFDTDYNLQQIECWDAFWDNQLQPNLDGQPEKCAAKLNDWLDFWSQGNHDDRTLALIYR